MPLKKLAKIIGESSRDSARARNSVSDPDFIEGVRKDRRGTLSSFETVQHALADREQIAKAKAAKAAKTTTTAKGAGTRSPNATNAKVAPPATTAPAKLAAKPGARKG